MAERNSQRGESAAASAPRPYSSAHAAEPADSPAPAAGELALGQDHTSLAHRATDQSGLAQVVGAQQDRREQPNPAVEANISNASRRLFGEPLSRGQLDALFQQDQAESSRQFQDKWNYNVDQDKPEQGKWEYKPTK